MSENIRIEGLAEMVKILDKLPDKLQKQAILKIERKSTAPLIQAARSKLMGYGSNFKKLAQSIGNITAKSKNPIIYCGPRTKGKWKYIGYISKWVEYGTSGIIKTKGRSKSSTNFNPDFAFVGKIAKGGRFRADQPARPFMRPAIDQTTGQVKDLFVSNMAKELDGIVSKSVAKLKK